MMMQREAIDLESLKQLKLVSFEMLAFAETADWNAVASCDNTRIQILKKSKLQSKSPDSVNNGSYANSTSLKARDTLVKTILELDTKIQEIVGKARKELVDKQIRRKAQSAAQSSYQQTLSAGTR